VRLERLGPLRFLFNYGHTPVDLPVSPIIGQNPVPPAGVAIWKERP